MRRKLELLLAWLVLVGIGLIFSCRAEPPAPPPKPIPTGFVYIEIDGDVREIPRAVWEFNPSAYPPPMDPQPVR